MTTAKQFSIFAMIGVLNTAVHFIVFVVLLRVFACPLLLASATGYVCGVANSYFCNRHWTFRSTQPIHAAEFVRFALVNGVSLLINLAVLHYLTNSLRVSAELAQVAAIGVSLFANFGGNKWWTFRHNRN